MEQHIDVLLEPLKAFLIQVGAFLPRLAIGLLVLGLGMLVAKAARFAVERGLRAINFHIVTQRAGIDTMLQQGGTEADSVRLIGHLIYFVVVLAALIIGFNTMGLSHVTELLTRVMVFVPKIFVAVLLLTFGAYFARIVSNAVTLYCSSLAIRDAEAIGQLVRYAVIAFAVMVALDQLEVGGTIVRDAFLLVLGGLMLAFAIAFGLGGRRWAAAQLERWWPSPLPPSSPPSPSRRDTLL